MKLVFEIDLNTTDQKLDSRALAAEVKNELEFHIFEAWPDGKEEPSTYSIDSVTWIE